MARNILIDPQRTGTANPNIQFSGSMANTIKLEVLTSGSVQFTGVSGSLLNITDSLSGSLFAVSDVSGLPVLEAFSDDRVVMGRFNANTLVVTGSTVGIGSSSPASLLDVNDSTNYARLQVGSSYTTNTHYADYHVFRSNTLVGSVVAQVVAGTGITPGTTNSYVLGTTSSKWSNVVSTALSGSLTTLSDGTTPYLQAGTNVTLTTGSNGAVTIAASLSGGGVSGTGTANYAARWTGTSTIGTGVLYDDGTNVGIGTTTAYAKLAVVSSGTIASPVTLDVAALGGTGGDARITVSQLPGGNDLTILAAGTDTRSDGLTANDVYLIGSQRIGLYSKGNGSTSNVGVYLGTNIGANYSGVSFLTAPVNSTAVTRMVINNTGSIGMGTITPTATLHVSGSSTSNNPTMIVQEGVASATGGVGAFDVRNSAGTSLLFVSGSGNVGIGSSSPGAVLDVNAGANGRFRFAAGGTAAISDVDNFTFRSSNTFTTFMTLNGTGLGIGATPTARLIVSGGINASTPTMVVKEGYASALGGVGAFDVQNSAGTSLLFVSGSGRVGIGSNSLVASGLTIADVSNLNNIARLNLRNDNSDTGNRIATIGYSGNAIQLYTAAESTGTANNTLALFQYNNAIFYTGTTATNPSERMRIDSSGNVGIGTNNPTEILMTPTNKNVTIGGYSFFGSTYSQAGTILGYNAKADTTNNVADQVLVATTNANVGYGFVRMSNASGGIQFHTIAGSVTAGAVASSERVRFTDTGNVGIGTTSPGQKLHVANAGATYLRLHNTTAGYPYDIGPDASGNLIFSLSGVAQRLSIDTSGNLLPGGSTSAYDLGSSSNRWRDVYARSGSYSGDVSISGNLTVAGTQTIINSTIVNISDNIILLNSTASPQQYGGIYVADTTANTTGSLRWNSSTDKWEAGLAGSEVALPTGTGTTNYVTKWTGTNTIGNGIATDNGSTFSVAGSFTVTDANSHTFTTANSTTAEALWNIRGNATKNVSIGFTENSVADRWAIGTLGGNSSLIFASGGSTVSAGTERMRLDGTGSLGLGSRVPNAKLHVSGAFGTSDAFRLQGGTAYDSIYQSYYDYTGTLIATAGYNGGDFKILATPTYSNFSVTTANAASPNFFVKWDGNVGIGVTSTYSRLTIQGSDATSSNSSLNVTNNIGASLLFVRNDGNVGIGSQAPATALDVSGVVNASTGFRVGGSATSGYVLRGNGTNFVSAQLGYGDLSGAPTVSGTVNYVARFTGTSTVGNSVIQDDGTRVGVGTTGASTRMSVLGTSTGTDTTLLVKHNVAAGSNLPVLDVQNSSGTSLLFVSGSGFVGINSSTPGYQLDVVGQGRFSGALYAGSTGAITYNGGLTNTYNVIGLAGKSLSLGSNSVYDRLFLDTSGNVGIGTAALDSKLVVNGTSVFSGSINPDGDLTRDAGSSTKRWNNIYAGVHVTSPATTSSTYTKTFAPGEAGKITATKSLAAAGSTTITLDTPNGAALFDLMVVASEAVGFSIAKKYTVARQYNATPVSFKVVDTGPGPGNTNDFTVTFSSTNTTKMTCTITNNDASTRNFAITLDVAATSTGTTTGTVVTIF